MTKTRSQTRNITIKKEEEEDDKSTLGLRNIRNTRSSGRIAKRKSSIINNRDLPAQQVKVEEDTDTKSLLQSSSKYLKRRSRPIVSQEQINQLIHYIVNDKMTATAAAHKVKLCHHTGLSYYNIYKNDPEKKIPLLRSRISRKYTQEQIEIFIRYISQDKISVGQAAAKANMTGSAGRHHYNKYLKGSNHYVPILQKKQFYTQDQKNDLIGYITNDKMSIAAASKKARMNYATGRYYYHNYFEVQNPDVSTPSHIVTPRRFTQEQLNKAMDYIINDKMSITAASKKANVGHSTTASHYRRYLKDHNMKVPVAKVRKHRTQDQMNELVGYIFNDKMSVNAASKKANISRYSSYKYYHQYIKARNIEYPIRSTITQEQKSKLIRYIEIDKMSIRAASKKGNMSYFSGSKYYQQYRKDQRRDVPTRCPRNASDPQE